MHQRNTQEYSLPDPFRLLGSRLDSGCGVWLDDMCDDVGYVYEMDISSEWNVMVFVPRIPQSGGKQKRDGQPTPHVWTAEEVTQQYGNRKVKVLGPNKFIFGGCTYEDRLAMEQLHCPISVPWSILLKTYYHLCSRP
jgi:hypothetical protein